MKIDELSNKEYSRNKKMSVETFSNLNSTETKTEAEIIESYKVNNFTNASYKPSLFYPKRTAIFWADVMMAEEPIIEFYKRNKESNIIETHKNATEGFKKVINHSTLLNVFRETEQELSLSGESDVALLPMGRTIVPLKIALIKKLYNPDSSLRYYHGIANWDQGTVPWIITQKIYYNDNNEVIMENVPYILEEAIDKDGNNTGNAEWVNVSVDKFNEKYKQELKHTINLGEIPFPVFTMTNTGNDRNGSGTSDWEHAQDILYRMDTVENAIDAAMLTNKQRVFKRKTHGSLSLGIPEKDDTIKQLNPEIDVVELQDDPSNPNGNFQITDRRLDITQWHILKDFLLNQYHSHTGESVSSDAHGNNQHTFEVQSKGDNKFRRGKAKINQRTKEIKGIIECIVAMATKTLKLKYFSGLTDIRVEIRATDIRNEYQKEERAKKLIELDLISKQQALEMITGMNSFDAELFLQRAKEFKDAHSDEKDVNEKDITEAKNDAQGDLNNETTHSKEND